MDIVKINGTTKYFGNREIRLNGMRPAYRADHIQLRGLADGAYRLLNLYIDLTAWDPKYRDSYALVKFSDSFIADFLGKDKSTVSGYRQELIRSGLIRIENGRVRVVKVEERYLINPTQAMKRVKDRLEFGDYQRSVDQIPTPSLEIPTTDIIKTQQLPNEAPVEPLVSSNGVYPLLRSDSQINRRQTLIEDGFYPESLDEFCFCGSFRKLIDCCAVDVYESLKGIRE